MQGSRNPESGVATNKERLLPRRQDGEAAGQRSRWVFFSSLLNGQSGNHAVATAGSADQEKAIGTHPLLNPAG